MQTITRVYTYDELTEKAKEKAKEWYLDDPCRSDIFTNGIDHFLSENFGSSYLEVQYSLDFSQGSGLNIYGKLYCCDMLDKIDWSDFTEKQQRFIQSYCLLARITSQLRKNSVLQRDFTKCILSRIS